MTRNPSETQATPSDPASEGPTDCVHCGQRIRRFGQTRRWCHDVTGNVQCKRGGVSGDVHPEGPGFSREARALTRSDHPHRAPAEDEAAVERHSYAGHPAAAVLADHRAPIRWPNPTAPVRCDCGWTGPSCDHPAHQAEMLHRAALLTTVEVWHHEDVAAGTPEGYRLTADAALRALAHTGMVDSHTRRRTD